jgi:hypothetical protein
MKNPTRNGILRMIARIPESKRWSETVTHIEILYKFLQRKKLITEFKEFESVEYKGDLKEIDSVLNNLEAKINEQEE